MEFSEHRYRRLAGGTCLIAGPAAILAGWIIQPSGGGDNTDWVRDVAAAPTRASVGMVVAAFGIALSVFAYLSLVHVLRERLPRTGDIGGALAVGGAVMVGSVFGYALTEVEAIRHLGDTPATVSLLDAIDNSTGMSALYAGSMLMSVGLLVIAVGLYVSQTTPRALSVLLAIGVILEAIALASSSSVALVIVALAVMLVALGGIGIQLITEPDEAWEHAPTFQGFHPVAG